LKRISRFGLSVFLFSALILVIAFAHESVTSTKDVVATQGTPAIDGIIETEGWGEPASVALPLLIDGEGGPEKAEIRAAYDDEYVYLSVTWDDPTATESVRKNMWTYDAATGSWARSGDEDRVYVLWNINAPDFGQGCRVYCHEDLPAWDGLETKMGTNNPGDQVDVWHWKAARTNPVGFADDKHWVDPTNAEDSETRLSDAGSGSYSTNKSDDLPEFMSSNDPGARELFLFAGSLVDFDAQAAWNDGDTIPGYILKQPAGSRGDVEAASRYDNGIWVVEFRRKLDTGSPDDAVFEAGNDYPFSLGISDNAGHEKSGALLLTLHLE